MSAIILLGVPVCNILHSNTYLHFRLQEHVRARPCITATTHACTRTHRHMHTHTHAHRHMHTPRHSVCRHMYMFVLHFTPVCRIADTMRRRPPGCASRSSRRARRLQKSNQKIRAMMASLQANMITNGANACVHGSSEQELPCCAGKRRVGRCCDMSLVAWRRYLRIRIC